MARRTAISIAQSIMNADFGDNSDVEGLSDSEELSDQRFDIAANVIVSNGRRTNSNEEEPTASLDDEEEQENNEPPAKKTEVQRKPVKIIWKKSRFVTTAPAEEVPDLQESEPYSPYDYFKKFIDDELLQLFSEKTNMYCLQIKNKNLNVTKEEIQVLLGIHIEIGSVPYPQLRMYWSKDRRYPLIADAMSFNRFSTLRNNLHCVDNLQQNDREKDKFWKVRPIMDQYLKGLFEQLPEPEKRVCVDEQMIPFKGRLGLKQYMKGKPNPWGIKLFFLCGESGMPYNFLAYQGKTTNLPEEYNHLGLSGALVMTLVQNRLKSQNYRLFYDNFFTSPGLVQVLLEKGIYCTGTLRSNRVGKLPIKSNSELSKEGRGAMDGCTSQDGKMCIVRWNDNSLVTVLSSAYDWKANPCQVSRYDKSTKDYVQIPCPSSVIQYNRSMGGVDKLDCLLALYRIHIKSKKWTLRVIFHFIDLVVVTSWLQYIKDCNPIGMSVNQRLSLLDFRLYLSECLIKHSTNPLSNPKGRRSAQVPPVCSVRHDGIGHFPVWKEERQRCKNPGCANYFSSVFCSKCEVSLCFQKQRNCFTMYHTP